MQYEKHYLKGQQIEQSEVWYEVKIKLELLDPKTIHWAVYMLNPLGEGWNVAHFIGDAVCPTSAERLAVEVWLEAKKEPPKDALERWVLMRFPSILRDPLDPDKDTFIF